MENEVVQLYLDDIIPNRFQPREVFDDQALKELAVSIREHGVIQPILVRKFGEKYEIIAGERRYKASTMAGLTKIPAIVKNLDDKESSKVALIENLQRRDLTPIEEARTYQKILDLDEMTQEQLAKTMGKSQSAVSNKLRLLSLPDEIQEALLKEEISERHARSLLNVTDKNVQIDLLKEIVNNKMTVRELDSRIKKINGDGEESASSEVAGGTTSDLFGNVEQPVVEEKTSVNNDSLFGTPELVNTVVQENNPADSLFGNVVAPVTNEVVENNNSLFGDNNMTVTSPTTEEVKVENSVFEANTGVDTMNNDSLFGSNPTTTETTDLFKNNMTSTNEVENSGSLFEDPTTVDINKIREQSSDINFNINNNNTTSTANIDSLLGKNDESSNRFIPNFADTTIEKTEDGNEVIGNGLLAGMPVIKPVDNEESTNTNNDANLAPSLEASSNNLGGNSENTSILFDSQTTTSTPSLNSLFGEGVPTNAPLPSEPISDLFGSSTQNAVATDNVISSNNVQVAVEDVKNVIKSYQEKGYAVSVEELDLDREIQLIIKFNKN